MCQYSSHRFWPVSEPAIPRLLPAHSGLKQAIGINAAAGSHPHPRDPSAAAALITMVGWVKASLS